MALPTPIEMPYPFPANKKMFDLAYPQDLNPIGNGFIQTVDRSSPFWAASWTTPNLSPEREQVVQQFLDALEGSKYTFLGYDPRKSRPYAYRDISLGTPWVANPAAPPRVSDTNYKNSTVLLDRLTPGTILTVGDMISFKDGNIWRLYKTNETLIAGADGTLRIKVKPRPMPINNISLLRLVRPCCEMKIMGKISKDDTVDSIGPTISFGAVQFLNRSGSVI